MSKHLFTNIRIPIEEDNIAIRRNESLCVKCGQCRRVCREEIAVGELYDLKNTGDRAVCVHCGQCANVCPVSSITEVYEYNEVKKAVASNDKIVIFSTSPSVRAALGEEFGLENGTYAEGKMVAALRALGGDYVLDTTFAADLTIVEEASELIERITKKNKPLPQFTSCCPAWVEFMETFYPEMLPHLSTAKSPIGMQGPTIKTYFARKIGIDPERIVNVAVTPCTAKKFEIRREEMKAAADYNEIDGMRDMDHVITTRELAKWLKEENINFASLEDSEYDRLLGRGSGAGIIFGNTGGVMEAALRTAYFYITGNVPPRLMYDLTPVRGLDGIKEAVLDIGDLQVKVAIVHGTANAKRLLEKLKEGSVCYDFIEVMTCRGGCIGGGGQPKDVNYLGDELRQKRINALYHKDNMISLRLSHENEEIIAVYKEFYGEPLSELAEKMLHTIYRSRNDILHITENTEVEQDKKLEAAKGKKKYKCKICGYEVEAEELPAGYKCPICGKGNEFFEAIDVAKETGKKKYKCKICGYEVEAEELPAGYKCPICGKGNEFFEAIDVAKETGKKKYKCKICGYEVEAEELPESYKCPICGKSSEFFEEIKAEEN